MKFTQISKKEALQIFLATPEKLYYACGGSSNTPERVANEIQVAAFRENTIAVFFIEAPPPKKVVRDTEIILASLIHKIIGPLGPDFLQDFDPGTKIRVTVEEIVE